MKFRDAKKLKEGDSIIESETQTLYEVTSVEIFMNAKQVRVYGKMSGNNKITSIFYNNEIELP